MMCSRCGAEAAIRREAAYYCGKCAVARDWGDVIAMVQDGPRSSSKVVFDPDADQDDGQNGPGEAGAPAATSTGRAADGDPFAS